MGSSAETALFQGCGSSHIILTKVDVPFVDGVTVIVDETNSKRGLHEEIVASNARRGGTQ